MGRISFTLDAWSDQNLRSYLAITAHWIAQVEGGLVLQYKSALIAFHYLQQGHSGEALAETVVELLDRAGITTKVRRLFSSGDSCVLIYSRSDISLQTTHQTMGL
jgi:hypothetical protein